MSNGQGTFSHRRHQTIPRAALCVALLIALPGIAGAFDVDYETGLGIKRSNNINLSEFDPISDTVITPQLRFEADLDGPRVQLAARGDAQYLHYTSNTFDDELRGTFAGKLNVTMVPDRVDFVFQDYLSRQPVDELAPLTPTNEQQANVFVAGPSLHARFGPATRGQLDLRYTNSYAEDTKTFNGDRFDAAGRVVREISATRTVSANLEATQARFDGAGAASDYDTYDTYFGYKARGRAIDANLDLGYSRLDPRGIGSTVDSALVRATLDWRMSPRSRLSTTVRHQLTDATQALITPTLDLDRRSFSDFRYLDVSVRPNPYRERLLRMRYEFTADRLTAELVPYYRRIRYLDGLIENEDRRGLLLDVEYRLRPRLSASLLAAREDREYVDLARKDKDMGISVGLVNRFTRHWTGRVDLQRRERDSTALGRSYGANALIVSLSYRR